MVATRSGMSRPTANLRMHGDVGERAGADLDPVRDPTALGDDVIAHLTLRVLGAHVDSPGGHLEDPGHLGPSGPDGILWIA